MSDLELPLTTALIVFVSAAVQSMTGFGFAVLAVPLLTLVWQPADAIAISMMLSTLCVVLLWPQVRHAERVPIVFGLFLAALAGLPIGLWALMHVDIHLLRLTIGVVTLATVVALGFGFAQEARALEARAPFTVFTLATGLVAGVLTGSLSMPGPPVVMLLTGYRTPKTAYRATLTAFAVLIYPLALAAMLIENLISSRVMMQSLLQTPVLLAGIWFGNRLHGAASERSFSLVSLFLLGLAGALCFVNH